MPSADPVSPARDVLPGLFDLPGCPACRHVTDASDSYLTALALGGHRDAEILTKLAAARGLCALHTRGLFAHPAAVARLCVVYRHVVDAALADIAARPMACPPCEQAAIAADGFFRHLLDEATRGDRRTYKGHGGLCVPHLRQAAVARRGADILWLVRFMIVRLTAPVPPGLDVLVGRISDPLQIRPSCVVCAAAAEAARSDRGGEANECLCAQHLRDEVDAAGRTVPDVLARQASLHASRLAQVVDGRSRNLGNYLSVRARRALADPQCPVCRRVDMACAHAVSRVAAALGEPAPGSIDELTLCLRHARDVHAVDHDAGRLADAVVLAMGQRVRDELTAAAEMTAVLRAAAFLDGSAFASPAEVPLRCA